MKPLLKPILLLLLQCVGMQFLQAQSSSMQSYLQFNQARSAQHEQELLALVSIPSISSIPSHHKDVVTAANWIVQKLQSIGCSNARLLPTEGNPAVYGSWEKAPGKPTLLIYAHYDVQPVKESEWSHPPFSPVIQQGKLYGRGASDDKSGVMVAIWAIEAMLKTQGSLPVNVKFLFEGEEEIGSPHFKTLLEKNAGLLKADLAVTGDDVQRNDSTPSLTLSLRGSVQLEFRVKTANTDAHSGEFGGKTPNSAVIMAQIISSLYDSKGNVAVAGFYDQVLPITAAQKAMIAKVPYDSMEDRKILGTTAEVGDTAYTPLERVWFRPTLEIIGLESGYTAPEGHANIIPGSAMARITCRLVNNQDGPTIVQQIVQHINSHCPPGASIQYKYSPGFAHPMQYSTDTKAFSDIVRALKMVYGREPLLMASGGSGGANLSFKEVLGVYPYSLGFLQSDENWHAPNEYFRLSSIDKGLQVYWHYLQLLGKQ